MATQTYTSHGSARRPSCRDILGAAGFSALTSIAALAIACPDAEAVEVPPCGANPSAELMALHDQFMVLQVEVDSINARERVATDGELTSICQEQADLFNEMSEFSATTPAEHRARARVFAAWYGIGEDKETPTEIDHDHIWPILRDLIGEASHG